MYMKLTVPQRINLYNCDQNRQMTLRSYLEWCTELGTLHLEQRGVDWAVMQRERQVFLLSRVAYQRFAPVTYGQQCSISTWEYGIKGPQFIRNFALTGESGETLAQSSSTWMLVDPLERKILRPSKCAYQFFINPEDTVPQVERFRLEELPEVARHQVGFSQIDCNGHMGNQYYADLISDYAPETLKGQSVQKAQLVFDHETKLGETIAIHSARTGPDSYAMYGLLPDGAKCFEALVTVGE